MAQFTAHLGCLLCRQLSCKQEIVAYSTTILVLVPGMICVWTTPTLEVIERDILSSRHKMMGGNNAIFLDVFGLVFLS